eukprot:gene6863-7079_t
MVPEATLLEQMAVINQAFAGSGFAFQLLNITYTNNSAWVQVYNSFDSLETEQDYQIRRDLRVGGADVLNVIITELKILSGLAEFPYATMNRPSNYGRLFKDFVFIAAKTLPGGSSLRYNLGHTLTHE